MTASGHDNASKETLRSLHWAAEASQRIDRTCQAVVAGRCASRTLGNWTKPFGLSESEFQVIWNLREIAFDGLDQATLAARLALSPAQLSATVDRLRAQNLIVRLELPHDRRRHLWQLTAVGRALLRRMLADVDRLIEKLPTGTSPAKRPGREEAA